MACGSTDGLQFDYIVPETDGHHKMGSYGRVVAYRRQLRLNNLQVLCPTCHADKGDADWILMHLPAVERETRRCGEVKVHGINVVKMAEVGYPQPELPGSMTNSERIEGPTAK